MKACEIINVRKIFSKKIYVTNQENGRCKSDFELTNMQGNY